MREREWGRSNMKTGTTFLWINTVLPILCKNNVNIPVNYKWKGM